MISWIKTIINKVFKLQDDRGSFRIRRIIYSAFSLIASRGVNMLVLIITLPLCLTYLGAERFGMMETIVALILMLSFADLGLGFGLQNRIAELERDETNESLKKAISSTFFTLVIVMLFLSLAFTGIYFYADWGDVFNVTTDLAREEADLSVLFFFVCFIIQIPFSIVRKVQGGFQESYYNELWRTVGNILGLLMLLLVVYLDLGVPYIILAIYGSNALFLIVNFVNQFFFKRNFLFPKFKYFDSTVIKFLIKDGVIFLSLQLLTIILNGSDRLLIAHFISLEAVAIYGVGYRLAMIFSTPFESAITPMLPAFNDALAKHDYNWIIRLLKKTLLSIGLGGALFAMIILLFGNNIITLWVGAEHILEQSLLLAFAIFVLYLALNLLVSYTMLTPLLIKKVIIVFPIAVAISLILKFLGIQNFGISGLIYGGIIGMTLLYFIPSFYFARKSLTKKMKC